MNEIEFNHESKSFMEALSYKGERIFSQKELVNAVSKCEEVIKQAVLLMPGKHTLLLAFKNIRQVAGDTKLAMYSAFVYGWSKAEQDKDVRKFIAKEILKNETFSMIPKKAFESSLKDNDLNPVADLACAFTYGAVAWGKSHRKKLMKSLKPKELDGAIDLIQSLIDSLEGLTKDKGSDYSSFLN